MCVVGFALPSSVFCAGEELHYLFLQCKATTRRDLTLKSRALSSLQLTLPTRMIPNVTLICVSGHVLCNISSNFFFTRSYTVMSLCSNFFFALRMKVVERQSHTAIFFPFEFLGHANFFTTTISI